MGICPASPEQELLVDKNGELRELIRNQLSELKTYNFANILLQNLDAIRPRNLYTLSILQDVDKMNTWHQFSNQRVDQFQEVNIEQELTNSCLILENQTDLLESRNSSQNHESLDSFQVNMQNNQSLIGQINILYSKQIRKEDYLQSLRIFLRWGQIFQKHYIAGFLAPFYNQICIIAQKSLKDFVSAVDQICVFVQFMVAISTQIYGLNKLAKSNNGKLIKNQNVYNFIMSLLFKRTKLRKTILTAIREGEKSRAQLFEHQITRFINKPSTFFQISKKFILSEDPQANSLLEYQQSLQLIKDLSKIGAPITKLKTIVAISKAITKDIRKYYGKKQKEAPEIDPDNLSAIVIYLLIKSGNKQIYEQLRMVEHFTTTNCLNCISGYYLNVFTAAIQSILTLQDS